MRPSQRLVRLVTILVAGGLALGVSVVALAPGVETMAASARYTGRVAPQLRALEGPTVLFDADGNVIDRLGNLDRIPVPLREVPKDLVDGVIAIEDQTFFTNPGVDVRSAVRALVENVDAGSVDQGGSTITQQLIKNRYFTNPKQDLDRKVREAVLATRLTGEWSKRRILEEYLNTIYFGRNAYGVNAAAQRIIGRPLEELDLADSALLAGVIKDPTRYDPFVDVEASLARRTDVLRRMRTQKVITKAEEVAANAKPLPTLPNCLVDVFDTRCSELGTHSPYATEVKNRLLELPELGATEKEAAQRVFAGGLRVYTALDQPTAWYAQAAVETTVGDFAPFTAAMAVMNPRNGEVVAIAGGTNPQGFNLATMGPTNAGGRAVGSTFKPITLATALANDQYSPKDIVNGGSPCTIGYTVPGPDGRPSHPWGADFRFTNAADGSGGTADLFSQTKNSVNCAYLRLMTSVGPSKVKKMAMDLGMTRRLDQYDSLVNGNLSMGIGETGHSPLEMATVYSTFASDGVRRDPVFIRRVEDSSGRVLYRAPSGRRVLQPEVARTVTDVLSHVTEGTAPRAKLDDRPMAGKTGTRDNSKDAWFAGYTPQLVAVVWMGDPSKETPMTQRRGNPRLRRDVSGDHLAEVHDVGAEGPARLPVHQARRASLAEAGGGERHGRARSTARRLLGVLDDDDTPARSSRRGGASEPARRAAVDADVNACRALSTRAAPSAPDRLLPR